METTQVPKKESAREKVQCVVCVGVGLVKKDIIVCDTCNGIKCMYCNSSGLKQHPYEPCEVCDGSGEVVKS